MTAASSSSMAPILTKGLRLDLGPARGGALVDALARGVEDPEGLRALDRDNPAVRAGPAVQGVGDVDAQHPAGPRARRGQAQAGPDVGAEVAPAEAVTLGVDGPGVEE